MAEETETTTTVNVDDSPKPDWGEDISPDKDGKVFKQIISEGTGEAKPKRGNTVYVHYTGKLLDGTVFDSSVQRNELFSFELGQGKVIKGWDVGVATMKKGEKCILTCTPEYAYGEQGAGENIPPNSTLQFEVELFRWQGEDVTNDGGVIKTIITDGEGYNKPQDGASVKVTLKGTVNDKVFDERTDFEFTLGEGEIMDVVEGVEKAIEKMVKGEVAEVVIQPSYGYGSSGSSDKGVPPNTEITYVITLSDFTKVKSSYEYDNVDERITDATAIKDKGSTYFKGANYSLALKVYRRALKLVEKESVYKDEEKEATKPLRVTMRLNIAASLLKLNEGAEALTECDSVLEEDPTNIKGLFRKGQAFQIMREYEQAMKSFQEVVSLEASNRAAKQQLIACKNKIKEQKEKDKNMYQNIFKKLSAMSEREQNGTSEEVPKGDASEPEKDAITEAMEKEEMKEDVAHTQEGTVAA